MNKLLAGLAISTLTAVTTTSSLAADPIRIGAATYGLQGEFMQLWSNALKDHPAVKSGDVEITVFDGRYDALVQSSQFDSMITRQYDAILFVPIDANACVGPVIQATTAGIPVVGSNTRCNTDQLAAFVGSDDVLAGQMVAEEVIDKVGDKGKVVIIEGPIGQSAQIDRAKGIDKVLAEHPDVKVLERRTANWSRAESLSLMENWLTAHRGEIDGVIAQNDEMAIGAIQAIQASGLSVDDISVAGVDGITDALKAVQKGQMATILQDATAQAQGALDVALAKLGKADELPQSDTWTRYPDLAWNNGASDTYNIPWTVVGNDNVESLLAQRQQ
uniref:substrate-binding domain-containing protein n=1 Tax=Halomonas sp. TaxID=1486246 RepID=UPI002610A29C|nr:substrate-binding domain-containing protein [Halomonas sp.]